MSNYRPLLPKTMHSAFENQDSDVLDRVEPGISDISDMTHSERLFLNGLIGHIAPRKMLEIGVSAGASSIIMLNATEGLQGSHLHSVDLSEMHYENPSLKTGYAVGTLFPHFVDRWSLHVGGTAARFMDNIGGDIDLCLLDTAHVNPGEFLDLLMVLPYLKPDAWVVIHDTTYHFVSRREYATTCGVAFASLIGDKYSPDSTEYDHFPNIGALQLSPEAKSRNVDVLFRLLMLPWHLPIPDSDKDIVLSHLKRNYDSPHIDVFERANEYAECLFRAQAAQKFSFRKWLLRLRSICLEPLKYVLRRPRKAP